MKIELPATPSARLDGLRALVSGASRGIGLASASALAEAGAHITLLARSAADLDEVTKAIRAKGGKADPLVLDICDTAKVRSALDGKSFDILVNSAGCNRPRSFLEVTEDDYDTILDLNLRAAFFLAQVVAAGMVAKGSGGSIIQISSQMGFVGGALRGAYSDVHRNGARGPVCLNDRHADRDRRRVGPLVDTR